MLERRLRSLYGRLGARYPRVVLVPLFALAYPIGLGGVALLRVYQDMSDGDMAVIAAAVVVLVLFDNTLGLRLAFRLVRPAERWLAGDHSPGAAAAAWNALANLPLNFVARGRWLAVLLNVVPISAFAAWR